MAALTESRRIPVSRAMSPRLALPIRHVATNIFVRLGEPKKGFRSGAARVGDKESNEGRVDAMPLRRAIEHRSLPSSRTA
jgi:hypothetical protein